MDKQTLQMLHSLKISIENIEKSMITKVEAENFASKNDLRNFATKDDLEKFATKKDLEKFPTKDDLREILRLHKDEIILEMGELVRDFAERLDEKKVDKPNVTLLKQ